jgi:hypothetical protein
MVSVKLGGTEMSGLFFCRLFTLNLKQKKPLPGSGFFCGPVLKVAGGLPRRALESTRLQWPSSFLR